jgi:CRISPR/Cas system-associated endonuclease/helicase Cas3
MLGDKERVLFMANTRRKARALYESVLEPKPETLYLSSGITKRARKAIIENLHKPEPATVVSTQVMEAGVDVSFTRMYREIAPLDNIVQAMGRLSREGEVSEPVLTIFRLNDDYKPYSNLEVNFSKEFIPMFNSSKDLYDKLPDYYKKVRAANKRNSNLAGDLESLMRKLDFDGVWEFVKCNVLPVELGDSIFVPALSEWDEVKNLFLSSSSSEGKEKLYKRFSGLMAELPSSVETLGLTDRFDSDLLSIGVLLPKKDALSEVYDEKIGLDKWVKSL